MEKLAAAGAYHSTPWRRVLSSLLRFQHGQPLPLPDVEGEIPGLQEGPVPRETFLTVMFPRVHDYY